MPGCRKEVYNIEGDLEKSDVLVKKVLDKLAGYAINRTKRPKILLICNDAGNLVDVIEQLSIKDC